MRTENNPLRGKPAPYSIKDIVLLVVTHLPCEEQPGYHKDRLEVVQTCLTTMRERCNREHTFFVWDNGSNSTFRDWLQHIFEPDICVLSHNIGKNHARANAIRALPLGAVVAYSDDDFYYEPDWLNPQLHLLHKFNAALVTGDPIRSMFRWGCESTINWARKHGKLEQGRFIPDEYERDYALSVGREWERHVELTKDDVDYRVSYNGSQAYCVGHHAQFVSYVAKILPALEPSELAMQDEKPFDLRVAQIGLRLATIERYTRHIGNVLDDSFKKELEVERV